MQSSLQQHRMTSLNTHYSSIDDRYSDPTVLSRTRLCIAHKQQHVNARRRTIMTLISMVICCLTVLTSPSLVSALSPTVHHDGADSKATPDSNVWDWDAKSPPPSTSSSPPSGSSPLLDDMLTMDNYMPPTPRLPMRFRAKCRFLIGPAPTEAEQNGEPLSIFERASRSMTLRPSLLLLHVDGVAARVREDFYALRGHMHRRFFTSIKHFDVEREWLIYHKQPHSPRACMEIPFSGSISSLLAAPGIPKFSYSDFHALAGAMVNMEYQGLASMQLLPDEDVSAAHGEQQHATNDDNDVVAGMNITLLHYRTPVVHIDRRTLSSPLASGHSIAGSNIPLLASAAPPVHVYLHPRTHQPLVITTPHLRVDILSFQAIDDTAAIKALRSVFLPQRASKARCFTFDDSNVRRGGTRRGSDSDDDRASRDTDSSYKDEL